MKTASVWLRPCKSSPVCKYSYDPEKRSLTMGSRIESDCGVWITYFAKEVVVHLPVSDTQPVDCCPLCKLGLRVAPSRELSPPKTKRLPLQFLHHDA